MKKILLLFIITFDLFVFIGIANLSICATAPRGANTFEMVLHTIADVEKDIDDEYGSKNGYKKYRTEEQILSGTWNVSQSLLVETYNSRDDVEQIKNACGIVAAQIIIEFLFYKKKGMILDLNAKNQLFYNLVDYAKKIGFNNNDGMIMSNEDNLIRNFINDNGLGDGLNVDNDYMFLFDNFREALGKGYPTTLAFANHIAVACGYVIYRVEYKTMWWTTVKEKKYFIIHDGWYDGKKSYANNYSYVDLDGMGTAGITKLL